MASRVLKKNVRAVGHTDLRGHPNGGQVVVQRRGRRYYAFVGHMRGMGTSIIDVTTPDSPEVLYQIRCPEGTHSHKVRVSGNIMLVNNELVAGGNSSELGLRIFDIRDLSAPKELTLFRTSGKGVHRFWIDAGKNVAYIPAGADGYDGNILRVVDFAEPRNPREISRWWLTGQWKGGGEVPTWDPRKARVLLHFPIVSAQRAYLAYWDAGFIILDISDIGKPKVVSRANYCPPYGGATHTALPVSREILGKKWLIVFDEALYPDLGPPTDKRMWVVDITEETNPVSVATFSVPDAGLRFKNARFGPHQPYEDLKLKDNLIFAAWFSGGLRVINFDNPYKPTEVGYFVPKRQNGKRPIQTNDVYVDDRGLIYLIDRWERGLDIVEYTAK